MTTDKIQAWEVSQQNGAVELGLPDMSSLDAVTRQLPQGLYTTFRTYDGGRRVLGLRSHFERLYKPATVQGIDPSLPEGDLRRNLVDLLQSYHGEGRVRLILAKQGQIYVAVEPLKSLPVEIYLHGVNVMTTDVERQDPRLKSTSFISASQGARLKIAERKVFEALLMHNGSILEGMTSNFFYIKEGKLGTAREGILLGVTRQTVLRVARGREVEIVYKPLRLDDVPALEEAFITSSSRGIVPVVQIDAWAVGEGRPGMVTMELRQAYDEYVLRVAERI